MGAILVYEINNVNSFKKLNEWLDDIWQHANNPNLQVLLVGNKCDLSALREVSTERALLFAKDNSISFLETSAKDNVNVHKAFQMILRGKLFCRCRLLIYKFTYVCLILVVVAVFCE